MMKNFTCLLILLAVSLGYSQTLPLDFSDPKDEFEDAGSVFNIIADPDDSNNEIGEIIGGGGQYDNIQLVMATYIDVSDTDNNTITFNIYTPDTDVMTGLFQLTEKQGGGPAVEVGFTTDGMVGWQTISLDFDDATNAFPNQDQPVELGSYGKIVFFTDFEVFTSDTYWIDDVAGAVNGDPVVADPTPDTAAPTPTIAASEVISMFSDAYDDVTVDTWNTTWSESNFQDLSVEGDPVKFYSSLNFNGIETVSSPIDASSMMYFHMNVWTSNITEFRVKLVDFLNDGFDGGNGNTEAELSFIPELSQWVTIDIPLADFTAGGMTSFDDINQLVISADPSGTSSIYIDNVYFSTQQTLGLDEVSISEFKLYPNPSASVWNIESDNVVINSISIYNVLGSKVFTKEVKNNNTTISTDGFAKGIYLAKVETERGNATLKLIRQ